jgi:hypothetical protein
MFSAAPQVVRHEERGERDHDQVVEEQRPAGEEADEVVEGTAHERGGTARLRDRGRALRVREGDHDEERADRVQSTSGVRPSACRAMIPRAM